MAGGRSTIGTILKCGKTASAMAKLCPIKSYPKLGGEPEPLETTDLEDKMQTYVPGVQSTESMQFTANYNKETYDAVSAKADDEMIYQIEFGESGVDGIYHWSGQHSVFINEGEVNGVREMTITITPATAIESGAAA